MRLILFFLLLSLGADAQIIRANPFYVAKPSGLTGFLLDDYPNAAAAYSLRKLKSSYSGSAIRIRRDSTGNAETDIGFTANGDLDTAAIKTHCRNNSCAVTTWYNQGDSASVNFTQTTAAQQPRIVTSGVIERRAGEPTIKFDGINDNMIVASSTAKFNYLHQTGQSAIFIIIELNNAASLNSIIGTAQNTSNRGFRLFGQTSITSEVYRAAGGANYVSTNAISFSNDTVRLLTNLFDNSNATAAERNILYTNGTNETKGNTFTQAVSTGNSQGNLTIGRRVGPGDLLMTGIISEIIIYPTNQSSNRTGIETNIINFFGL